MAVTIKKAKVLIIGAVLALTAFPAPALACLPSPSPAWGAWIATGVPMYLGRVERVVPKPPVDYGDVIRTDGVAEVRLVEVIQGTPTSTTAQTTGALSFSFRSPPATPLCGANYLDLNPGDLVVVVENGSWTGVFGRGRANEPTLAPYFEKHQ